MKRRLVLTNEAARHPFRASIPPAETTRRRGDGDDDVKLFALSFAAFFTCCWMLIF